MHELSNLRQLAERLDEVRAETARDIAGRLHDDLSQQCHHLLVHLHSILGAADLPDGTRHSLERLREEQQTLVSSLQGIWGSLRPPLLDEFGARASIEHLASAAQLSGIARMDVDLDDEVDDLTGAVREVVVLVVQEALSNVTSHARASRCSVSVTCDDSSIAIEVTDNGVGYHARDGFGLRLMRERVRRFGGFVEITPGPAGGTSLMVQLERNWTREAPLEGLLDPHVILKSVRDDEGRIVDFVFTEANDAAIAYLRRDRAGLAGARLLALLPGHRETGLLTRYIHTIESGEPLILDDFPYDSEIRGSQRRYDVRAVRIGDSLSYTWRDVTERHELTQSYRLLAENASDIVFRTDVDGVIEWVSPSVTRVLGWEPSDVMGHSFLEIIHPDDNALSNDRTAAWFRRIDHWTYEARFRNADGDYHWYSLTHRAILDESGTTVAHVGSMHNVDDERAFLERLQHSEINYRRLAENAGDVVYEVGADRVVRWISPSVRSVLGHRPSALVGRSSLELIAVEHHPLVDTWRQRVLAGESGDTIELGFLTDDGGARWMSAHARAMRSRAGVVDGLIVSLSDCHTAVTTRRALHAVLAASRPLDEAIDATGLLDGICRAVVEGGYESASYHLAGDHADQPASRFTGAAVTRALHEGVMVVCDEVRAVPGSEPTTRRSGLAVPVTVNGAIDGVWEIVAPEYEAFGDDVRSTFGDLARRLGRQLERLRARAEGRAPQSM